MFFFTSSFTFSVEAMPGTFSKYFYDAVEKKTCAYFLHPGLSCTEALKGRLVDSAIGSLKFFVPVCVIPFVIKIKKWKEAKVWKIFVRDLGKCLLFGFLLNVISFTLVCYF